MRRAFFFLLVAACSAGEIAAVTSTPPNANIEVGASIDASVINDASDAAIEAAGPLGPNAILAGAEVQAQLVVVDHGYVYWTTSQGIRRVSAKGGTPETVAKVLNPVALAIADGYVFTFATVDGTLRKAPISGGATTDLATGFIDTNDIKVHGGQVYFSADNKIRRVSVNGGAIEAVIDPAGAASLAVDDTNTNEMFETWADAGGGQHFSADDTEGLRSAMEDYTDARVMVLTGLTL